MKIRQHRINGAKTVAGRNEHTCLAVKGLDITVRCSGLETAHNCRADSNDASALRACLMDLPTDISRHLENADEFMKYWVAYLTERVRDLSKRVDD